MAVNPKNRSKRKRPASTPAEIPGRIMGAAKELWAAFNERMSGEPNAAGVIEAGLPKSSIALIAKVLKSGGPKAAKRFAQNLSKAQGKTAKLTGRARIAAARQNAEKARVAASRAKPAKTKKARDAATEAEKVREDIVKSEGGKIGRKKPTKAVKSAVKSAEEKAGKAARAAKAKAARAKKAREKVKAEKEAAAKRATAKKVAAGAGLGVVAGATVADRFAEKAKEKTFKERDAKNKEAMIGRFGDIDVIPKPRGAEPKTSVDSSVIKERPPKILDNKAEFDKLTFGQAFRVAKNSTAKEFTWRGRRFHTRTQDEEHAAAKKFVEKEQAKTSKPRVSDEKIEIKTDVIKERPTGKKRIRGGRRYGRKGHQRDA
jgi:hypothetical protein